MRPERLKITVEIPGNLAAAEPHRNGVAVGVAGALSRARTLAAQGTQPMWARNVRVRAFELFYIAGSGMLTSVPIRTVTRPLKKPSPFAFIPFSDQYETKDGAVCAQECGPQALCPNS